MGHFLDMWKLWKLWKMTGWWWLEHDWIMTFHSVGNFIMPTDFHSIIFQRGRYTTNQTKSEFQAWTGSIRCQIRDTSTRIGSRWLLIFWMVNRLAYTIGGAYLARLVTTRLRIVLWLYWCIFWGWPTRDSGGTIWNCELAWLLKVSGSMSKVLLLMVAKSCTSWWVIPLFIGLQHVSTILLVVQDFATIHRSWWPLEWLILWRWNVLNSPNGNSSRTEESIYT